MLSFPTAPSVRGLLLCGFDGDHKGDVAVITTKFMSCIRVCYDFGIVFREEHGMKCIVTAQEVQLLRGMLAEPCWRFATSRGKG